ncbi:MAG: hypothetical protein IJS52_10535 [Bacilli bacterium]|nr:hypothetical protein [Bacilli bacterium]
MNGKQPIETVDGETYYEVPGIDLDGKPTTFKILLTKPQENEKEKKKTL